MSKVIKAKIMKGSFKFLIKLNIFGIDQVIPIATYDTGCSHSLISVSSLDLGNIDTGILQHELLTDINIQLTTGVGVESNGSKLNTIKNHVKQINKLKAKLKKQGLSIKNARKIIESKLPQNIEDALKRSKNIRYTIKAHNYEIEGVNLGDIDIRVSFNTENKNLIGMHIIQNLYTKIFKLEDDIFLIASLDNISLLEAEN